MISYPHSNYLKFIPTRLQHCTLDNFDFSSQKDPEKLQELLTTFIEERNDKNGLYLYGTFGVGKTHLLISLYRVILAREQDVGIVHFISCEKIIRDLFSRIDRKETTGDYIDYMAKFDWLFLDDLTAMSLKEYPLEVIRQIINYRYEQNLPTCFSANASLDKLMDMGLHPHAISRIAGMCEVYFVEGRDRRLDG